MNDSAHKAAPAQTSQRDFNAKLHFLRVKAHQELALAPKEKSFAIPPTILREQTARRIREGYTPPPPPPQWEGRKSQAHENPNKYIAIEFQRGSVYLDAYVEEDDITYLKNGVMIHDLPGSISIPDNLGKDNYPPYQSPKWIESQITQQGAKSYQLNDLQKLVWVQSQQDGGLYILRLKDLDPKGGIRKYAYKNKEGKWQGPQTALHIPYIPNEIYSYLKHPAGTTVNIHGKMLGCAAGHWENIGNLSEEQAQAKTGFGPPVQAGRLETVPYLEVDKDDPVEDMDFYDHLDNDNYPMVSAE